VLLVHGMQAGEFRYLCCAETLPTSIANIEHLLKGRELFLMRKATTLGVRNRDVVGLSHDKGAMYALAKGHGQPLFKGERQGPQLFDVRADLRTSLEQIDLDRICCSQWVPPQPSRAKIHHAPARAPFSGKDP
jgi:hypothetical protein